MNSYYRIIILFIIVFTVSYCQNITATVPCHSKTLALYSLTLHTFWNKNDFPKQYPLFRPPAQWSKLSGITHDSNTILWRSGELSRDAISQIAEIGHSEILEDELYNNKIKAFNEFRGPPITTGQGMTSTRFFADGNNTLVSLIMKIIPSPDWFIGLDSFDLCKGGYWIDSATIQLEPMDAGTDDGFTFTSPNWKSEPRQKITHITSRQPNHPANSFYYPEMEKLPGIGKVSIKREKVFMMMKEEDNKILTIPEVTQYMENKNNVNKAYFVRRLKKKYRNQMSNNSHKNSQQKGVLINCASPNWKKSKVCKQCKSQPSGKSRKVIVLGKRRRKLLCPKVIPDNDVFTTNESTSSRKPEKIRSSV